MFLYSHCTEKYRSHWMHILIYKHDCTLTKTFENYHSKGDILTKMFIYSIATAV